MDTSANGVGIAAEAGRRVVLRWYRKQFHAGSRQLGSVSRIVFDGSDYFATVWLNGTLT